MVEDEVADAEVDVMAVGREAEVEAGTGGEGYAEAGVG